MIISRLQVWDFGIFYGSQVIEHLRPGLYVVHGRNGLGKTTLINAVRWCLFGKYCDRQNRVVPPEVTLNRQARREGRTEFAVEMVLSDGDDEYLIRRKQFVSPSGPTASQPYMERNRRPLTAGERERLIPQILSEEVARFFLFDGEELRRYESLVAQEDGGTIKQEIEQILGLPVLDNTLFDLEAIQDDFNKRLAREARRTQQLEQLGARAEQFEADLASKDRDISALTQQRLEQLRIIAEKDGFLQQYENQLDQVKKLETLDERVEDIKRQRNRLRDLMAEQLHDVWRDVLAAAVGPKVEDLRQSVEESRRALVSDVLRKQLQQTLDGHTCALCRRPLEPGHERHIASELDRYAVEAANPSADGADALVLLQMLAPITDTGRATMVVNLDKEVAELESQDLVLRQDISRLREALENLPEGEVSDAQRARDGAQQELGRLTGALEQAGKDRGVVAERLQRARDEIRRAQEELGPKSDLSRSIDLAEALRTVVDLAKARYRNDLRRAVEASATDVFRHLTNEPAYQNLRINDNYGLEMLDGRGQVLEGRSAGQEQVVALALIAALNRNARRRAPVIMDTPFGRLDPEHRANILQFVGQLADQVFLLVHGGEVREDDLLPIAARINERFELERVDPDRTEISLL